MLWVFAFSRKCYKERKQIARSGKQRWRKQDSVQKGNIFREDFPLPYTERLGIQKVGLVYTELRSTVPASVVLWGSTDRGQEVRQHKVAGIQAGSRLGVNKCLYGRDRWEKRLQSKAAEKRRTRLLCPPLSLASRQGMAPYMHNFCSSDTWFQCDLAGTNTRHCREKWSDSQPGWQDISSFIPILSGMEGSPVSTVCTCC